MSLLGDIEQDYQITEDSLKEVGFKKRQECGPDGTHYYYDCRLNPDISIEYWMKDYKGQVHAGGIPLNGKVFVSGTMYVPSLQRKRFVSYIMEMYDMLSIVSILDNVKNAKVPSYVKSDDIFI